MSQPSWMQPPRSRFVHKPGPLPKDHLDQPHQTWPWNLPVIQDTDTLHLEDIDVVLQRNPGKGCQVAKYSFTMPHQKWEFREATTALEDIKDMVRDAVPPSSQGTGTGTFL